MNHTPGPWRWGYWTHLSTKKKGNHFPFYEFKEHGSPEDGQTLSNVEYGTVAEWDRNRPPYVLQSHSTGHGGETDVDVGLDDAKLIAAAPDLLDAGKALLEVIRKHHGNVPSKTPFEAERLAT